MTRLRQVGTLHVLLVLAIFGAGVVLRATNLGGPAFSIDEFSHPFAARSVLAGEGFHLPSGQPYTRARLMTLLTAGAFALFGEGEAQARLPALAFGTLTLALTYVTGRVLFGPTAGLVALLLLALSPDAIDVDRFARVYSPLTFFVLLAALAAFRALERAGADGPWPRADRRGSHGWLALAMAAGLTAFHFHSVALALLLVVQAYAAALAVGLLLGARYRPAARYGAIALGLLLLEALAAASPGLRARVVETALTPLPWYDPEPGEAGNYHYHLATRYVWLWYLSWPATLLLVLARPRAGLFVALAFWLPFVLMSGVVVNKQPRYIAHLLPCAWLLLGGAADVLWPAAHAALLARLNPLLPAWVPRRAAVVGVLLLAAAPVVRLTPSVMAALRRPWQTTGAFTTSDFYDWRGLARLLGPRLEPEACVVSSIPLAAPYYLGRPGYLLVETFYRRGEEEGLVQRPADFAALRARGAPVWVIAEAWRWAKPGQLDAGLKQVVTQECRSVAIPPALAFVVFACAR